MEAVQRKLCIMICAAHLLLATNEESGGMYQPRTVQNLSSWISEVGEIVGMSSCCRCLPTSLRYPLLVTFRTLDSNCRWFFRFCKVGISKIPCETM